MKILVICMLFVFFLTSCTGHISGQAEQENNNIEDEFISGEVSIYEECKETEEDTEESETIIDKIDTEQDIQPPEIITDDEENLRIETNVGTILEEQLPETELNESLIESLEPYREAYEYYLSVADHAVLDFSYHEEYMNYAICDFAIAPNGNLLLLILSDSIVEYTPEGEFVGQYSYGFSELGLTAYMLTCDEYGNFYMADGKNNAIIKADRQGIKSISFVGERSGMPALTLSESMYARDEDCLEFLNYNDKYEFCIYQVYTGTEEAVLVNEPIVGQSLGGGSYAHVEMVRDENGDRTSECTLTVKYKDGTQENYRFRSEIEGSVAVYGLGIYGITEKDTIIGYIREWYMDGGKEKSLDTKVKIEKGVGITAVGINKGGNENLTRSYGGETYIMQRMEDGIRIVPLGRLYTEEVWSGEHWYLNIIE